MTADATGPVPDDVIDAVADAVFDDGLAATWMECFAAARAVLSVPAVAAVFARDTQVREIVERCLVQARGRVGEHADHEPTWSFWRGRCSALAELAAFYAEDGAR